MIRKCNCLVAEFSSFEDLNKFIEDNCEVSMVKMEYVKEVDSVKISFKYNFEMRSMFVCRGITNKDYNFLPHGLSYMSLSLGSYGESSSLMLSILSKLSGWIDFIDADEVGYQRVEKAEERPYCNE